MRGVRDTDRRASGAAPDVENVVGTTGEATTASVDPLPAAGTQIGRAAPRDIRVAYTAGVDWSGVGASAG